jgi:hypothetical protein
MLGLQGISQLYGVDTGFLNSLNAGQNQLVSAANQTYGTTKSNHSFGDILGSSFASGLGSLLSGG